VPEAGAANMTEPAGPVTRSKVADPPDSPDLPDPAAEAADDPAANPAANPAAEAADEAADELDQAAEQLDEAVGRMDEAVAQAAKASEGGGLGRPGRPMNHRSPFFIGMGAATGVAVTVGLLEVVIRARSVLILTGLALFIAAGLDPAVGWLTRHGMRRWLAVLTVLLVVFGALAGFLAAAIPPLASQTSQLADHIPHYARELQDHSSQLGKLNAKYHLEQRVQKLVSSKGSDLISGLLGAGEIVLGAVGSLLVVVVLTVYFLAGLPRIKLFAYRLAPHSRRARVILLGDEIFTKVGAYVLGNFATSAIAGIGTFAWMMAWGIPYPVLLGIFVAFIDLIPVIGSTIGGAIVTLVALTVSVPVALATLGFYVAYRLAEDYLLVPRIMGRAVQVPAVVSVLALLIGGALLGIIGALVAIPAAAALRLWLDEVAFHRLDNT
jgi:predicted PurR-regulated permease PerM